MDLSSVLAGSDLQAIVGDIERHEGGYFAVGQMYTTDFGIPCEKANPLCFRGFEYDPEQQHEPHFNVFRTGHEREMGMMIMRRLDYNIHQARLDNGLSQGARVRWVQEVYHASQDPIEEWNIIQRCLGRWVLGHERQGQPNEMYDNLVFFAHRLSEVIKAFEFGNEVSLRREEMYDGDIQSTEVSWRADGGDRPRQRPPQPKARYRGASSRVSDVPSQRIAHESRVHQSRVPPPPKASWAPTLPPQQRVDKRPRDHLELDYEDNWAEYRDAQHSQPHDTHWHAPHPQTIPPWQRNWIPAAQQLDRDVAEVRRNRDYQQAPWNRQGSTRAPSRSGVSSSSFWSEDVRYGRGGASSSWNPKDSKGSGRRG